MLLGGRGAKESLWGFSRFGMTIRDCTPASWIFTAYRSPRGITTCRCRGRHSSEEGAGDRGLGLAAGQRGAGGRGSKTGTERKKKREEQHRAWEVGIAKRTEVSKRQRHREMLRLPW